MIRRRLLPAAASALVLAASVVWTGVPAGAASPGYSAWATTYTQHWSPNGNCGVAAVRLDSRNYAALNLYANPRGGVGAYRNGGACGRFVRVTIQGKCVGVGNGGGLDQGFCRGGRVVRDRYSGASLDFVIADSCPDDNGWCRQDPYHLDLSAASLGRFVKDGRVVRGLAANWNNRRISWTFVPAPGYRGDIRIGFVKNAQRWWPSLVVSHLARGVRSVEYWRAGWHRATRVGTVGEQFTIGATTAGGTRYAMRVRNAYGTLVGNGRIYRFALPAACASACAADYTPVRYATGG